MEKTILNGIKYIDIILRRMKGGKGRGKERETEREKERKNYTWITNKAQKHIKLRTYLLNGALPISYKILTEQKGRERF